LCDPCVKLEFASNIITNVAFTGTISFQVFKLCRGQLQPIPIGPAWLFTNTLTLGGTGETFSFFVCDCDSCFDDCCTYTVVATNTSAIVGGATIGNATLGAVATCGSGSCNC
jgi:hypothetical protein